MKIGFLSLGCPKNLVDTEVMVGLAQQAGHTFTADPSAADVIVVNTCGFIDTAKQESIDAILEMAEHKRTGTCSRLVVAGCLAERYGDELRRQIPEIDSLLGTGEVAEIVSAVSGAGREGPRAALEAGAGSGCAPGRHERARPRIPGFLQDTGTPRTLTTPGHYAYLKVAEGCSHRCAFCVIPRLRGPYRSRSIESVVEEARSLVGRGVREIILVSQDTSFYGVDRQERHALGRLLRQLNQLDGLCWIRVLYLYPTTIDEDALAAMADCEKVCKYVDLPLQHAAGGVLARMGRPGNRTTYSRLVDRIRARVEGVAIRTTFIVGFPGESTTEFRELYEFVREMEFDHVGVFPYSHEAGTRAFSLRDDIRASMKRARRARLMELQRRVVGEAQRRRIGQRVRVLVDGPSPEHALVLKGRLEGQAPEIDSVVYLTDCDPVRYSAGDFVEAEIVDARDYDLVVRPLP